MAKAVIATNGRYGGVVGSAELTAGFKRLPDLLSQGVQQALDQGAQDIVDTYRELAPVAPEFERHPGEMRDSAHVDHDGGRALSASVVVDAKDSNGQAYPAFVEYGHKEKSGAHVPAKPALWPAYRRNKGKLQRRVRAATKAAIDGLGS